MVHAAAGARRGWLAEAQGFFALSFRGAGAAGARGRAADARRRGQRSAGASFRVSDIKQATCIGGEGELPFAAPRRPHRDLFRHDRARAAAFAGLEIAARSGGCYVGEYVEFDALEFSQPARGRRLDAAEHSGAGLIRACRRSERAAAPAPPPSRERARRAWPARTAAAAIEVRANGISVSAICASCGAHGRRRQRAMCSSSPRRSARRASPRSRSARRGALVGTEWEVVGYQQRSNPAEGWTLGRVPAVQPVSRLPLPGP